jgi:sensor histidine kinase YesM
VIKVNDRWLRIALSAIPCSLFLHDFIISDGGARHANIIYTLTVILVCEGSRFLCYSSRRWFTGLFKNVKRLSILLPSGILFVASTFVISKALRNYIAYGESGMDASIGSVVYVNNQQVKMGVIGMSVIYATLTFLLLLAIYELAYHFARLRHTERQRDRLEKEKLHAELQHLKGIVNPHFLFNNLNSLSSLISENPAKAEDFLNELTKVFRYLLHNNETELTTLGEELQFLKSYYSLLETRYGKGITMNLMIDSAYESFLLPPLTLQLLVENAVKHNRIQKEDPLRIELFVEKENFLGVRNNLSLRDHNVESTGIGLRNINSRYKLLKHQPPVIEKSDGFFLVIIPLIPSVDSLPAGHTKPKMSVVTTISN